MAAHGMKKEYPRSEAELEAYRLADRLSGRCFHG